MPNESTAPTPAGFDRGAVGIILYNNTKFCEECLISLDQHLPKDVGIIVVDNGSKWDIAAELTPKYPRVHFVRVPKNTGIARGLNTAADYGFTRGAPFVYLVNDDAVGQPGFWEACETEMRARGPGLIASIPRDFKPPHRVQSAGVEFDRKTMFFDYRAMGADYDSSLKGFYASPAFVGVGFLIARETWTAVGEFNEDFGAYFEDFDYCLRAGKLGHVVGTAGDSTILHHGTQSMGLRSPRFLYCYLRNELWFRKAYMEREAFRFHGRFHVVRKAIYYFRTTEHVRRSLKCLVAISRGLLDGLFGRPGRTLMPKAYQ